MTNFSTAPYTIAFFTTGTELEYSTYIAHIVTKVAEEQHVNIINFLGGSLNPNFSFSHYKYQYQCNVAFNFAHTPHIDGIILASGILSSFLDSTAFDDFYNQFKPTPLVSLGVHIPGLPSVYTNNEEAYIHLVSHIIKVHKKREIAFISGPSSNTDAFQRYVGYRKALAANNIAYKPQFVYIGDFTPPSARDAIHSFIDQKHLKIDAIVCANDSMALTVIHELKQRNIAIPEEIMVTGCDDIPSAAFCVPSLTTIEQALEEAARSALGLLIKTIKGEPISNVIIPSKIVYRQSCSYSDIATNDYIISPKAKDDMLNALIQKFLSLCPKDISSVFVSNISIFVASCCDIARNKADLLMSPYAVAHLFLSSLKAHALPLHTVLNFKDCIFWLKNELFQLASTTSAICYLDKVFSCITNELIKFILEYYDLQTQRLNQNFYFTRQFLSIITHNINDKCKQLESIIPSLIEYGINSCLIYLYPTGVIHNLSDPWHMPDEIYLYMGFVDGQPLSNISLPLLIDSSDIATFALSGRNKNYVTCLHPIFFSNEQLGIGVFEMAFENYSLIETLTMELACALKLSSIFNTQQETENKLATLSQTDELTQLLNRRGFFNLAQEQYITSTAAKQNGILFYADMDGLKIINDTYGHDEGDFAIIAMANILKNAFDEDAVIGRIGGDEFTILCLNKEPSYIKTITDFIMLSCQQHNQTSFKPYELNISMGGISYSYEDTQSLEYLISRADKLLYDQKHAKKALKLSLPLEENSLL